MSESLNLEYLCKKCVEIAREAGERILEIYLNTVDWGSGLMGAESASSKYFHRSSARISPHQAALLAAILPNPDKWSRTRPSAWVLMRQKRILKDMKKMPLLN